MTAIRDLPVRAVVDLDATGDQPYYVLDDGVSALVAQIIDGTGDRVLGYINQLERGDPQVVADAWAAADTGDWQAYNDRYRFDAPDGYRHLYPQWYNDAPDDDPVPEPEPGPPPLTLF